ncbi:hypothetical protein EHF33_07755 [Deinococcus psychrotolerans]|uniref:Lipoprotein n=1 Tax=Deinococcus psychrotolerans TaxID=2489213 RepID=A0A3G8YES9_9DEIO|nr:hypothetical protein [Deinococcus psychrotolerans]AZI42657.1 hypothetical protein EHF33_07755 [Deinococcus psychrotolerans]
MTNLTLKQPALALALLGTSLVLGACGSTTPVTPPAATTVNVISGTITPWIAGRTDTISSQRLNKSATVNGTGNFDLGLPDAQTTTSQYSGDLTDGSQLFFACSGGTVSVTPNLKYTAISGLFLASQVKPEYFNYSAYSGTNFTYRTWWFVNKDATVTSNGADCAGEGVLGKITANLNLKQGWNIVEYARTGNSSGFAYNLSSVAPNNSRMSWRPNPNTDGSQSLSLGSQSIQANPWSLVR